MEGEDGVRVLASAEGSSKKEAQQRAAELALVAWTQEESKADDARVADGVGGPREVTES
jgi:hypothetical protein